MRLRSDATSKRSQFGSSFGIDSKVNAPNPCAPMSLIISISDGDRPALRKNISIIAASKITPTVAQKVAEIRVRCAGIDRLLRCAGGSATPPHWNSPMPGSPTSGVYVRGALTYPCCSRFPARIAGVATVENPPPPPMLPALEPADPPPDEPPPPLDFDGESDCNNFARVLVEADPC